MCLVFHLPTPFLLASSPKKLRREQLFPPRVTSPSVASKVLSAVLPREAVPVVFLIRALIVSFSFLTPFPYSFPGSSAACLCCTTSGPRTIYWVHRPVNILRLFLGPRGLRQSFSPRFLGPTPPQWPLPKRKGLLHPQTVSLCSLKEQHRVPSFHSRPPNQNKQSAESQRYVSQQVFLSLLAPLPVYALLHLFSSAVSPSERNLWLPPAPAWLTPVSCSSPLATRLTSISTMENLSLLTPSPPSNCAPCSRPATPRRAPDMESYSPSSTFPPPSAAYTNPHASTGWDYPSPPGSPANHQEWRGHPPAHCSPVNEPPSKADRGYHAHFQGSYPEYPDGNRLSLPPPSHGISQVPSTSDCGFPGVLTPRSVDFPSNSPTQGLPAGLASSRDHERAAEAFSDTASMASYYRQRQMQHHNVFSGGHRTDMGEGVGGMTGKETGGGERWKEGVGGVDQNHQMHPRGELFSRRERADLLQPTTSSAWSSFAGRDETTSCISSRSPRFLQKERIANKDSLPPAGVVSASWRLQEEERKNMEAYKRRQREAEELEQRRRLDQQRNIGRGGGGLTRERGCEQSLTDLRSPSNFSCASSHFAGGGGHTPRHQSILPDSCPPQVSGPAALPHSSVRECVPPLNLNLPQGNSGPYLHQDLASANGGAHDTSSPSSASAPSYFEPPQKRRSGGSVADSVYAESVVSQRSRRDGDTTFIPRCDDRSARVKHIEGLKSTGSVIPLSAEARSAVVRAESRAALGKQTHLVDGDRPLMGDGDSQPAGDVPYPLNRMDGRNELLRRIEGDKKRGRFLISVQITVVLP